MALAPVEYRHIRSGAAQAESDFGFVVVATATRDIWPREWFGSVEIVDPDGIGEPILVTKEQYESIAETAAILGDADSLEDLREGIAQLNSGRKTTIPG